jgi:hypothetical protein
MNMTFLKALIVIAFFLSQLILFSCESEQSAENVIKMSNAQIQALYMSDYFESIEYIPLETKDDCLIGIDPVFYFTADFIIAISPRRERSCHLFDRHTGKFIRKIGNVGNGPRDYLEILSGSIVNEQKKTISFGRGDRLIEYSLTDGVAIPVSTRAPLSFSNKLAYISNDIWAVGLTNPMGNNPNEIIFFNREEIIDSIPNQHPFTLKSNMIDTNTNEILFYSYDNSVYYKNFFNDTIFKIVDRKMKPEWVFDMLTLTPRLFQLREDPREMYNEIEKFQLLTKILETDENLFFDISYQKQKQFYLFDKKDYQLTELEHGKFINDMDGGLAFWPTYTNRNQEIASVYQAFVLKDEMKNNNTTEESVKNVLEFRKLRTLASQIDEEDNPIVVIAKLKK